MKSNRKIRPSDALRILWPYAQENFTSQLKSIWFIVVYLVFFQVVILELPLIYTATIAVGIVIVILGLTFFMEGLRLGLMPLGETIGSVLPRNAPFWSVLLFAFCLGVGATFAEPAIAVLRSAGANVQPDQAPLLYSMLNDFANQLVAMVGLGVGIAVLLGVLRFYYLWSLKIMILPLVILLGVLTIIAHNNPVMQPILGLAWDCGAVTTGPVTVPLVLALGIGVCRVVGDGDTSNAGFGIVTLASLFPILMVLILGFSHYLAEDYYGQPNYQGSVESLQSRDTENSAVDTAPQYIPITQEEYESFLENRVLTEDLRIRFEGGEARLINGQIVLLNNQIILEKPLVEPSTWSAENTWNPEANIARDMREAILTAVRAIVPLCLFLLFVLWSTLKLKGEKFRITEEMGIGIVFSIAGMALFVLGIILGLTPLGSQLGGNIPVTFTNLTPWGLDGETGPLYDTLFMGKFVAVIFGFFLGYGATLAEPALNALGATVEKITTGAFKKTLLMQSVAIGVGFGIATGVLKIAFNIPLAWLIIPPYFLLILLTLKSSEEFVNFAWDSAGVTTGPITVPLVLAMGLGIGGSVPGVIDGFGVLALASVGPIITVLFVGIIVARTNKRKLENYPGMDSLDQMERSDYE